MNEPTWKDVDESVTEMAGAMNAICDGLALIKTYIENLDASEIKKTEAQGFKDALHLCEVIEGAHYSMCEHSINLFNKLQKSKGNAVGW